MQTPVVVVSTHQQALAAAQKMRKSYNLDFEKGSGWRAASFRLKSLGGGALVHAYAVHLLSSSGNVVQKIYLGNFLT